MAALESFPNEHEGPIVQFGRFIDGRIELFKARTTEQNYIAISHVWGEPQWRCVDNLSFKILASKAKVNFVKNKMAKLLGSTPFWMDTITVNQKIPAEVIDAVQSIPAIFRDASKTLVLRERGSLQDCCVRAIAAAAGWNDLRDTFVNHVVNHFGMRCYDSYLERLWIFQEVLLSHTIEFVYYGPCLTRKQMRPQGELHGDSDTRGTAISYLDALFIMGRTFYGTSDDIGKFVKAYIIGEQIKRSKPPPRTEKEDVYSDLFREFHLFSTRSATVPRDYIFATMPQFPWYHYPDNAITMSFGDIFSDLFQQAGKAGRPFVPRITRSMTDQTATGDDALKSTLDLPEPKCLGDFLKLLGQPGDSHPHFTTSIVVRTLEDECAMDVLDLVAQAMMFSRELWNLSDLAPEVSRFGAEPEIGLRFRGERNSFLKSRRDGRAGGNPAHTETIDQQQRTSEESDDITIEKIDKPNRADVSSNEEAAQTLEGATVEDHGFYKIYRFDQVSDPSQEEDDDDDDEASSSVSTETRERYVNRLDEYHDEHVRALRRTKTWQHREASRILTYLWRCFSSDDTRTHEPLRDMISDLLKDGTPSLLRTLLLQATMIGCQIPLSATSWAESHFIPVKINYGTFDVLGLLARHYVSDPSCAEGKSMYSYGRHKWSGSGGRDLVIVDPQATGFPIGLIPDFYNAPRRMQDIKGEMAALYDQTDEVGRRKGGFRLVVV